MKRGVFVVLFTIVCTVISHAQNFELYENLSYTLDNQLFEKADSLLDNNKYFALTDNINLSDNEIVYTKSDTTEIIVYDKQDSTLTIYFLNTPTRKVFEVCNEYYGLEKEYSYDTTEMLYDTEKERLILVNFYTPEYVHSIDLLLNGNVTAYYTTNFMSTDKYNEMFNSSYQEEIE